MNSELQYISIGQIIEARKRLWRVDEVRGEELIVAPIDGDINQRIRLLTSVEGYRTAEAPAIDVSRLGDFSAQKLLLRAYRLSLLHGSAPFQSLQRSSVIPVNYQLVPLVMALEAPRVRMLIADDVGLGKTIEAGLIVSELLARSLIKRVLVVTPAQLREQWQQAMGYFFHLNFKILSSETRRHYERLLPVDANPWQHFNQVIVSFDYAKMVEHKFKILEHSWDMVVVDEAHNGAKPHQSSSTQRVTMERWELIEQLSDQTPHVLLLTATPHNGYRDSFASLLRMLNPDYVSGDIATPLIDKHKARRSVCQRTRKELEKWYKKQGKDSPFPGRDQKEVTVIPHPELPRILNHLDEYNNILLKSATASKARILTRWLVLHFQKRALSSPQALRVSINSRIEHIWEVLKKGEVMERPVDAATARRYVTDYDTDDRLTDEELRKRLDKSLPEERQEILKSELKHLENLKEELQQLTLAKDKKLQKLLKELLPDLLHRNPKLIIFTYYKDTLDYLERQVGKRDIGAQVLVMHGDMSSARRQEVFVKFEKARKAILISTDVIAEGLNLQHACSQVIHYELPWNPNRLEQRNGRVDRFGQPEEKVTIRTLVTDRTLDIVILHVLMKKAAQIREDRGYSPPFFGDEANLAELIAKRAQEFNIHEITQLDLFTQNTENVKQVVIDNARDPYDEGTLKRIEDDSFYDETDVSLPDIEARLKRTERLIGSSDEIQNFVESALNRFGCSLVPNRDATFKVNLPDSRLQLPGIGGQIPRATFDPKLGLSDPTVTILDIGHPLLRRLIDLVKGEFFQSGATGGRATAVVKKSLTSVTAVYHALVRFTVNTDPPRVIEELIPFGFEVYENRILGENDIAGVHSLESSPRIVTHHEASIHLESARNVTTYDKALAQAVETRRQSLVRERRELMDRISGEAGADYKLLRGLDELNVASTDVLTVTLLLPR